MTTAQTGTTPRNFSPWFYWVTRLMATTHEDPLARVDPGDAAAVDAWRTRCRQRLAELLGPQPARVPLNLETLDSVPCDGYRRDLVVFDVEDVMSVPAYLLVPDDRQQGGEPGPAVLAVHGHGPGKALVCGLESTEAPNGDYAVQLVRQGFVVLAPDLRCFGERQDWNPEDHYACDTNLVHAVMAGWNPLTQNLWDLARSLDVLEQHPLVDPARIGVAGLSLGGTMSLLLAATDERVSAAVVSGYLSSWGEAHKVPWNMCGSQVLFGMLGQIEHVDLGALVAPRPLLVETGTEDLIFPLAAAKQSMDQLQGLYLQMNAADRLEHDVFEGDHQWHGVQALPFLRQWLSS